MGMIQSDSLDNQPRFLLVHQYLQSSNAATLIVLVTISFLFQVGYMLHDRVLRPAEVGVTEGGPIEEEPEEKSDKSD